MIRVGIGGWTFAPWRGTFYPAGLRQADELAFAASKLTSIEINGTFYRTQSAASFAKWRDQVPDDFVFSVKGHRSIVNKSKLAEAKESVDWFLGSGLMELGDKLGPILWQLAPFKRFDQEDIAAFFSLLPRKSGGRELQHVIEPRHGSFRTEAFVQLARNEGISIAKADSAKYPSIDDLSGAVVYARLQNATADEPMGYPATELDQWASRAGDWEAGKPIAGAPLLATPTPPQDQFVFIYIINGAKERAPAAAQAMIERVTKRV